jgi:predicted nucleic acid-binding protein
MDVKVVDASAIGAIIFGEDEADIVASRLSGSGLVAPALLGFEIGNIAVKKIRRYPQLQKAIAQALDIYARIAIETIPIDLDAVVMLAGQSGLTAYDAAYLWLARHLDAELITLDRRLEAAAKQMKIA